MITVKPEFPGTARILGVDANSIHAQVTFPIVQGDQRLGSLFQPNGVFDFFGFKGALSIARGEPVEISLSHGKLVAVATGAPRALALSFESLEDLAQQYEILMSRGPGRHLPSLPDDSREKALFGVLGFLPVPLLLAITGTDPRSFWIVLNQGDLPEDSFFQAEIRCAASELDARTNATLLATAIQSQLADSYRKDPRSRIGFAAELPPPERVAV